MTLARRIACRPSLSPLESARTILVAYAHMLTYIMVHVGTVRVATLERHVLFMQCVSGSVRCDTLNRHVRAELV